RRRRPPESESAPPRTSRASRAASGTAPPSRSRPRPRSPQITVQVDVATSRIAAVTNWQRAAVIGAWAGAVLGALLVVVYDTSADVSVLEGRRGHMAFANAIRLILALAGGGAVLGVAVLRHRP